MAENVDDIDKDMEVTPPTTFQEMYEFFLAGITDDMFMELTKEDTEQLLEEILIAAVPKFEFPHWAHPFKLDYANKCFTTRLSVEEMTIIRYYMIAEWLSYQLATVDLIRQKYSSTDFSFTSQANHMKALISMKQEFEQKARHAERLYCRRYEDSKGHIRSSFGLIMEPVKWH